MGIPVLRFPLWKYDDHKNGMLNKWDNIFLMKQDLAELQHTLYPLPSPVLQVLNLMANVHKWLTCYALEVTSNKGQWMNKNKRAIHVNRTLHLSSTVQSGVSTGFLQWYVTMVTNPTWRPGRSIRWRISQSSEVVWTWYRIYAKSRGVSKPDILCSSFIKQHLVNKHYQLHNLLEDTEAWTNSLTFCKWLLNLNAYN